jgi:uncharacterized membrane protein
MKKRLNFVVVSAIFLFALYYPLSAFAEWKICNHTGDVVGVALGFDPYKSEGWYDIAGCSCRTIWPGNSKGRVAWWFAHAPGGDFEAPPGGDSVTFCVNLKQRFNFGEEHNKPGSVPGCKGDDKLRNFFIVRITTDNFNTNLNPPGQSRCTDIQ